MSNIFNDSTETELNERTINFQNLSVLDTTIPILGSGNIVSGQIAGVAGLDLISKDTLDDVKDDVLGTRLKNLSTASITAESVATINGNTISSVPILQGGKDIINQSSIGAIRALILENVEEALVIKPTDGNNEINFHTDIGTGNVPDASNRRLTITSGMLGIRCPILPIANNMDIGRLSGTENHTQFRNFISNNIVSNTFQYNAQTSVATYIELDAEHSHFRSPNGIRINEHFQIDSRNGAGNNTHIFTTNTNKNIDYTTAGTGEHTFYTNGDSSGANSTEILKISPTLIDCSKPVSITGDCTATSFTGPLNGNASTSTKIASITNSNIVQLDATQTLTNKILTSPTITGTGAIAGVFAGDLNGNASTSTKIASITNSNIVQLDATQTLTNKILTSPTITGTGAIAGVFAGDLNGNASTSTKIASITNSNIVQLDSIQNLNNKTLTNPSFNGTLRPSSIYFRVVDLPSTPTQNDYDNVYTLNYFYSLPLFIDGLVSTYTLNSLANMTNGYDWTNLELKGMIIDLTITAPINGTMYLKHTSDDGARVFLNSSSTPLTTTNIFGSTLPYPGVWTNQGPTSGYASFGITAGTEYRIRLQYVENSGGASCSFEWNTTTSYGPYSTDWSSIITNNNNIGSASLPLNILHTNLIDFSDTLSDKIHLYGNAYKFAISNNSLDYITGNTHTFKQGATNLFTLNTTEITTYKNITPSSTNNIDIGKSDYKFNIGYINTLKASSINPQVTDGNLTLAGNGTGKIIVNSTLESNSLVSASFGVIGTTTSYAKFGVKTLGGAISIGNAAWDNNYSIFGHGVDDRNFVNNSFQYGLAVGIGTNSTAQEPYGVIKCIQPGLSWRDLRFSANRLQFDQTGTERMRIAGNIVCSTNIIPDSTINNRTIGSAGNLWNEIFCGNATINTSDRTKKKDIDYENIDKYADQLLNLKPCTYKFIKNSSNRNHMGLISQDLEGTIFEKTGTFIKSPKTKTITETIMVDGMKSSRDKEVEIPNEYDYGLRYGELIAPMIRLLQKQQKQINELLTRVSDLESGSGNELSFI
jgi:hypothetical protein